jgi:hypothetical protein
VGLGINSKRGSAASAPRSSSASLAWNTFSNCRASAMANEFLAGRMRRCPHRGSVSQANVFEFVYELVTQHS